MKYILLIRPCSIPNMCNYVIRIPFQNKISYLLNYLIFKCYSYTGLTLLEIMVTFIYICICRRISANQGTPQYERKVNPPP